MSTSRRSLPYDVIAIDDTEMILRGLQSLPVTDPGVVASVRTYKDVASVDMTRPAPDVVILDLWLAGDSVASIPHIAGFKQWGAHVLLYTSEKAPVLLRQALTAGADGLCLKVDSADALVDAMVRLGRGEQVFSGPLARAVKEDKAFGAMLTPAEAEVLRGMAHGLTSQELADRLTVAKSTVDTHAASIRQKYGSNMTASAIKGMSDGWLKVQDAGQDPRF